MLHTAVALSLLLSAPALAAGPFGFEPGMTLAQLKKVAVLVPVSGQKDIYGTTKAPKPHSMFESYVLWVHPKFGLLKVGATGKNIDCSPNGAQLRSAFDELRKSLDEKYGEGMVIDRVLPGAVWDEDKDFMTALGAKQRVLVGYWSREKGLKMPEGIDAVGLEAVPLNAFSNKGFLRLAYEFKNFAQASEANKQSENENL